MYFYPIERYFASRIMLYIIEKYFLNTIGVTDDETKHDATGREGEKSDQDKEVSWKNKFACRNRCSYGLFKTTKQVYDLFKVVIITYLWDFANLYPTVPYIHV
mmetsp:Transcript_25049/g.34897  ORF Transcript_25049/g.34897 Transcript_25049/m.34897 type:complete len:103 (-) Transcript_25049:408-716(-)